MELQLIRSESVSPSWLNELSKKYRRDHAEKLQKLDEKRQKEKIELINEVVAKLEKQEPKVETTEVEKPSPTVQDNKIDAKAILDVIKEISATLETHAGIIEDLSDRVDALEQRQTRKTDDRSAITHNEPSELDLQVIQSRFEAVGLTGEIKKILPYPFVRGRFVG